MIMFGFFHRKQPADSNDGVSLQISDEPCSLTVGLTIICKKYADMFV